jgi:hypothetical protein
MILNIKRKTDNICSVTNVILKLLNIKLIMT